jgi:isocitrate dehydrogenase (NAD+)
MAKKKSTQKTPYPITLIPGDGIGPEIVQATLTVLEATGVPLEFEEVVAGEAALALYGDPLPDNVLASIHDRKVALKGPLTTPVGRGFRSINVRIRKALDLYANLRPIRTFPGVKVPYPRVDMVIIRENTEDLYSGLEHVVVPGVVESLKVITERASLRIAEFAFRIAEQWNRKKVTSIHKANIMKLSDGLFLEAVRKVAIHHSSIAYEELIVDNAAMQMVMNPTRFDVVLTENLYGDIMSDLAAGLVGGLGFAPSANIGDDVAVFEAVHGSAPDIAGKNIANPIALILAGALMLDWLGERKAAASIRHAVEAVLQEGKIRTPDLGGSATTQDLARAIADRVRS